MPDTIRPGDLLAGRYRVAELLDESGSGRFWRADDLVLQRHVAVHVVTEDDPRAEGLLEAARRSVAVHDRRILKVLDADIDEGRCYIVNEWGTGTSLDILLARDGPLMPRRAAWMISEVAAVVAAAHEAGIAHGRLAPENVLIDPHGEIRVIGFAVEAALWGLPPGRMSTDAIDLGALLYAALTGRWAGVSKSQVPAALQVGGRVLRPRKVRAGIPRALDELCDEVLDTPSGGLHVRSPYDLSTARGIADALEDFVGDPTGLAIAGEGELTVASEHAEGEEWPMPRYVRESEPGDDPGRADAPTAPPSPQPAPSPPAPAPSTPPDALGEDDDLAASALLTVVDQPTQAGMPVFDDDGDVNWMTTKTPAPLPPPPFEEPPERPLFAPAPAQGEPARKPRPGVTPVSPDGFWPWDGGPRATTGSMPGLSTTGSGIGIIHEEPDLDDVPGRRWMRLAAVIGVLALVLLGVVFAIGRFDDGNPLGLGPSEESPSTAPTITGSPAAPKVIAPTTATDLDPEGTPPEENRDLVARTVDGDPATAWRTETYRQQLGPGGLKLGVGVIVDLGKRVDVRRVTVDLLGEPTGVRLYVTDTAPTSVSDLTPAAAETAGARLDVPLEATGQYVVVWLTSLPPVDGGFRGQISEIVVRG